MFFLGKKMFHAIGLMAKEMDGEYPHLVTKGANDIL